MPPPMPPSDGHFSSGMPVYMPPGGNPGYPPMMPPAGPGFGAPMMPPQDGIPQYNYQPFDPYQNSTGG